jgi:hypothetical protein
MPDSQHPPVIRRLSALGVRITRSARPLAHAPHRIATNCPISLVVAGTRWAFDPLAGVAQQCRIGLSTAAAIVFPVMGFLTESAMISAGSAAKGFGRRVVAMLVPIVLRAGVILLFILGGAFLLLWSALILLYDLLRSDAALSPPLLSFDGQADDLRPSAENLFIVEALKSTTQGRRLD